MCNWKAVLLSLNIVFLWYGFSNAMVLKIEVNALVKDGNVITTVNLDEDSNPQIGAHTGSMKNCQSDVIPETTPTTVEVTPPSLEITTLTGQITPAEVRTSPPEVLTTPAPTCEWISAKNGGMPPGAVLGGRDIDGKNLFVARALHDGVLVPGKFAPSHEGTSIGWAGKEHLKTHYEVLCNCSPKWVQFRNEIPLEALPAGKTKDGKILYVGRSLHEESLTPGRIDGGCRIPFNYTEIAPHFCEILTI